MVYLSLIIIKLVTPELAHHESQHLCSSGALPCHRTVRPGPLQSSCSKKLRSERGVTCTRVPHESREQNLIGVKGRTVPQQRTSVGRGAFSSKCLKPAFNPSQSFMDTDQCHLS